MFQLKHTVLSLKDHFLGTVSVLFLLVFNLHDKVDSLICIIFTSIILNIVPHYYILVYNTLYMRNERV